MELEKVSVNWEKLDDWRAVAAGGNRRDTTVRTEKLKAFWRVSDKYSYNVYYVK